MELLEKTRKINKLLQRGEKVEYNAIARQFQILNIKIRNVPLLKVQNAFLIRKKLLSCLFTVTANVLVL